MNLREEPSYYRAGAGKGGCVKTCCAVRLVNIREPFCFGSNLLINICFSLFNHHIFWIFPKGKTNRKSDSSRNNIVPG